MTETFTLNTDGGSRGNPGKSAIAYVIKNPRGEIVKQQGKYIGIGTNNEAEYQALILGLESANDMWLKNLSCLLDSELVVMQLNGKYKVKIARLKAFYDIIKSLEKKFEKITYEHVRRTENKEADALVNEVLDSID